MRFLLASARGALHAEAILHGLNVGSLRTFLTLLYVKRYFLTFCQFTEAFALDGTEVNEYVGTAIVLGDETETFVFVEPLNCTS
jgi:hypothetical protein